MIYKTRNGRTALIKTTKKPGMSVFIVYGSLDGKPCHWTAAGKYRMDDQDSDLDLVDYQAG